MFLQRKKSQLAAGLLLAIAGFTTTVTAGPVMRELHHTVEEARITVDSANGTLTAKLLECPGCKPATYTFNNTTRLINPMGAERPISDLQSWSRSRAAFTYRLDNKHIEHLKILP